MATNKVIYNGSTLIDLSTDTVSSAADIVSGKIGHLRDGTRVTGTASGGGGSTKNIQVYSGIDYARSTSYTATDVSLTVSKSGTYDISWIGWRSTSSGTSGSQLYVNGSSRGSAVTSFTGTYGQHPTLSNVQLDEGDVLVVRARSRNSSSYMYVGNLIIEEQ